MFLSLWMGANAAPMTTTLVTTTLATTTLATTPATTSNIINTDTTYTTYTTDTTAIPLPTTTTNIPSPLTSNNNTNNITTTNTKNAITQLNQFSKATTNININMPMSRNMRKRHSKRHSNSYDWYNFNENATTLEWFNPCGGFYTPQAPSGGDGVGFKRKNPKQIINALKKAAGNEYRTLIGGQQDIDISSIKIWSRHEYAYKFLPKLKLNSTIALKRWHRNMQTYVASFAYLHRIQLNWDHWKSQRESNTARELKHLLISSRGMQCELETAFNNTHPYQMTTMRGKQLPEITRAQMNKRLKFRTKRRMERHANESRSAVGELGIGGGDVTGFDTFIVEADTIDLKFVKYYYYRFLEVMWKVLRKNTKRKGQIAMPINRSEFNEIEKNFGSIATTRKPYVNNIDAPITTTARPARVKNYNQQQRRRHGRNRSNRKGTRPTRKIETTNNPIVLTSTPSERTYLV